MPLTNKVQKTEEVFWYLPETNLFDPTKRMKILLNVVGDKEGKDKIHLTNKKSSKKTTKAKTTKKSKKSKFPTKSENTTKKRPKKFQ